MMSSCKRMELSLLQQWSGIGSPLSVYLRTESRLPVSVTPSRLHREQTVSALATKLMGLSSSLSAAKRLTRAIVKCWRRHLTCGANSPMQVLFS